MQINRTIKKHMVALGVSAAIGLSATSASADGLQSELDRLFYGMTNATEPGVFDGQRRGVLTGGRVTVKQPIMDINMASMTTPSMSAGCGGLDMYGGSFSFINGDQIVQLLRSIGANAKGYFFQLALDAAFPSGATWLESWQKKLQSMNQHLGNSCQLAQGLVDGGLDALGLKQDGAAKLKATGNGIYEDFFSSGSGDGGSNVHRELSTNDPEAYRQITGNIVWTSLKTKGAETWFTYGDTSLGEAIMGITGTIIVGGLEIDSEGNDNYDFNMLPGGLLTLEDLVFGGTDKKLYTCASDTVQCNIGPADIKQVNIRGIKSQLEERLLGPGGVINKYATNSGTFSTAEADMMASLPAGVGGIIRNLAVVSPASARLFASESSGAIATAMVYDLAADMIRAARIAVSSSNKAQVPMALEMIRDSENRIRQEKNDLIAEFGDLQSMLNRYQTIMANTRKERYTRAALNAPTRTED